MWKLSGKLSIPGRRILLDHYMVGHGPIELVRKLKKKKKKTYERASGTGLAVYCFLFCFFCLTSCSSYLSAVLSAEP